MGIFARTPNSVDEIMTNFTDTIKKLRGLAEYNSIRSEEITEVVKDLTSEREALCNEALRAEKVASQLEGLINVN